ncbi:Sensor histidine kinase TodS [Stieleria neptunia]|uniref:histidine kinase n=1 Tax=Stieleria neptunia TaxID=2527979 RepID=A0A518I1X7_9BACT|nr:ATP-binding protein [Stieleria neptunia]QDV47115.1 Sensor histidine kinase TodS [Stieleria neptunia]
MSTRPPLSHDPPNADEPPGAPSDGHGETIGETIPEATSGATAGRTDAGARSDETAPTKTAATNKNERPPRDSPDRDGTSGDRDDSIPTLSASQFESEHSQSLRSKLVLALALMLGVVVGIDEIVRQKVIAPEFANLERVAALKDTNRVLSAINTEVEFLSETAAQDAIRIDIHLRAQDGGDPAEQLASAMPLGMLGQGKRVEWAAITRQDGNWTWLTTTAPATEDDSEDEASSTRPDLADLEFPGIAKRIAAQRDVASGSDDANTVRGMTRGSDGQLYLFAAVPLYQRTHGVPHRNHHGAVGRQTPASFYVVGRQFGDAVMTDLQQRTSVLFSVRPLTHDVTLKQSIEVEPTDSSLLCVRWPLLSPSGSPLAELSVHLPREVTSRSNRTTAFARYLSLCGACASLLLLLLLLQRIVIGRIERIREHTEQIARTGIISEETGAPVLRVAGHDEIGQLAQSFDRMRTRLGDAQRRLSDASHAAGMSLVADTVIHNVGNVLTNVNSLIETATRRVESLRIEPLEKLASRLRQDDVDIALQRATPDYLQRLSATLEDDKDDLAALLQTLNDNIQHIHQVIRDQRRHANQPIKWAHLDVNGVIAEAVRCSQARLEKDNVSVDFKRENDVLIWTDRSLLLQILINIITNAGNATQDICHRQPTLTIDLIRTKTTVRLRFRDNGCGMDEATLARVFDAHFTTRQSGSGLGLHFCAIAMKRIGGAIHAESDGPDRGATFILEVPVVKPSDESDPGHSSEAPDLVGTASGSSGSHR